MEPNYQDQSDVIEIDIVELLGVLMSKLWVLIVSTVIFTVVTFLVNMYVITPMYESVTKIYIINRQSNESLTYSDLQSGTQLTKDYQELVKARPVLEEVRAALSLEQSNDALAKQISVSVPTDTRIVAITVEDADPYMARDIADAVRNSASAHIENVMATEAVNVVEEANLPTKPSSPKIARNTAIGGIVGLVFAMAIIIIIYIMDDTIKNPDDIENYLHLSVLGSIPDNSEEARKKRKKKDQKARSKKKIDEEEYHSKDEYIGAPTTRKRRAEQDFEGKENLSSPSAKSTSNKKATAAKKSVPTDTNEEKSESKEDKKAIKKETATASSVENTDGKTPLFRD